MNTPRPQTETTPSSREVLRDLASCGSSEALAVADCLQTIAENGDEQAETSYLVGCAEEIVCYALHFIERVKGAPDADLDKTMLKFMLYAAAARAKQKEGEVHVRFVPADVQGTFDVTEDEAAEFLFSHKGKIEDRLTELGNEVIDTFGQMAKLKPLDEDDEQEENEPPQDTRVEGG